MKEKKEKPEIFPLTQWLVPATIADHDDLLSIQDVMMFIETNAIPFHTDNLFAYMQKNYPWMCVNRVYLYAVRYAESYRELDQDSL